MKPSLCGDGPGSIRRRVLVVGRIYHDWQAQLRRESTGEQVLELAVGVGDTHERHHGRDLPIEVEVAGVGGEMLMVAARPIPALILGVDALKFLAYANWEGVIDVLVYQFAHVAGALAALLVVLPALKSVDLFEELIGKIWTHRRNSAETYASRILRSSSRARRSWKPVASSTSATIPTVARPRYRISCRCGSASLLAVKYPSLGSVHIDQAHQGKHFCAVAKCTARLTCDSVGNRLVEFPELLANERLKIVGEQEGRSQLGGAAASSRLLRVTSKCLQNRRLAYYACAVVQHRAGNGQVADPNLTRAFRDVHVAPTGSSRVGSDRLTCLWGRSSARARPPLLASSLAGPPAASGLLCSGTVASWNACLHASYTMLACKQEHMFQARVVVERMRHSAAPWQRVSRADGSAIHDARVAAAPEERYVAAKLGRGRRRRSVQVVANKPCTELVLPQRLDSLDGLV